MNQEHEAEKIIRELARNAASLKSKIKEGALQDAIKLTGERVALVEALRHLRDAKVSLTNSDVKDEMTKLIRNSENDISEATGAIRNRLSSLLKELGAVRGAKKIAAYAAMQHSAYPVSVTNERDNVQGGRYGY